MIRVVAVITAKPGRREELLAAAHANIPKVLAEEGCLEYGPVIDAEGFGAFQAKMGPDVFVFIESWASADALKAHGVAPHMVDYGKATKDLVADRKIHIFQPA